MRTAYDDDELWGQYLYKKHTDCGRKPVSCETAITLFEHNLRYILLYTYVENGYYEGSGKNCNIRAAKKCVILVLKHIQRQPDRSLGIIAFSEKQQTAIENAIIDFRERNPQYET